ncbi:MAG: RNA methyltransferase [Halothiobacillaceae bacterium]|nr:RNA methyltransferase [Halothiobacillaceae bacterium]MDY0050077.1 RNA methyltransferase [Halothiobacillaceae bacterium]
MNEILESLRQRVRIVLVETSHPGNIGAAARALSTMGLARLTLVAPRAFPHADAVAMASGATDVLEAIRVCATLDEALQGVRWVAGATARLRHAPMALLDPRQAAGQALAELAQDVQGEIALVFGREHAGLTNDELERCHALLHIPANPAYSSLNLAAAVQVLAYELRMSALGGGCLPEREAEAPASADALEGTLAHLERVMVGSGFLDPANPRHLMRKMRRFLYRARPVENEIAILRGFLSAVEKDGHAVPSRENDDV